MTSDTTIRIPARLHALAATAMLLEKLERLPRTASATQYQRLVAQLNGLLDDAEGEPALQTLLDGLPALAELHENRHYAEAGLCCSPLDGAVLAERQARDLLQRLRTRH
jgi:hypothetical protein